MIAYKNERMLVLFVSLQNPGWEPGMPKVSGAYLEARREQILDAAIVCFARKGFIETTIHDLCRQARLSTGAVYRYFPSKQDVIEASVQRYRSDRAKRLAAAESKGTIHQGLDELINVQALRWLAAKPDDNMRVMLQSFAEAQHNPQVKHIVRENWEDIIDRIEAVVRRAQASGQINGELDPRAIAMLLNAMHDGLLLQRAIISDRTADLTGVLQAARALFVTGDFWPARGGTREGTNESS